MAIDTQTSVSHQNNLNKAFRTSTIKNWTWKRLAPIVIMWKHIHHTVHVLKQLNLKHSFVLAKRFFKNILFLWFIDLKPKCIPTISLSLNKKMKWLMDKSQIINKCSSDEIMHGLNLETEFSFLPLGGHRWKNFDRAPRWILWMSNMYRGVRWG